MWLRELIGYERAGELFRRHTETRSRFAETLNFSLTEIDRENHRASLPPASRRSARLPNVLPFSGGDAELIAVELTVTVAAAPSAATAC